MSKNLKIKYMSKLKFNFICIALLSVVWSFGQTSAPEPSGGYCTDSACYLYPTPSVSVNPIIVPEPILVATASLIEKKTGIDKTLVGYGLSFVVSVIGGLILRRRKLKQIHRENRERDKKLIENAIHQTAMHGSERARKTLLSVLVFGFLFMFSTNYAQCGNLNKDSVNLYKVKATASGTDLQGFMGCNEFWAVVRAANALESKFLLDTVSVLGSGSGYVANDVVGTAFTRTLGTAGWYVIRDIVFMSTSYSPTLLFHLFSGTVSGGSFVDNTAIVCNNTENYLLSQVAGTNLSLSPRFVGSVNFGSRIVYLPDGRLTFVACTNNAANVTRLKFFLSYRKI